MATYKTIKNSSYSRGPTRPDITFKFNCEPKVDPEEEKKCEKRTRIGRGRQEASRPHIFCRNDGYVAPPPPPPKCEKKTRIGRGAREQTVPHVYCRNDGYKPEVKEEKHDCCYKVGIREPTRPVVYCRNDGKKEKVKEEKHECCKPTAPSRRKKNLTFCKPVHVEERKKKECPRSARNQRAKPPVPTNACPQPAAKSDRNNCHCC